MCCLPLMEWLGWHLGWSSQGSYREGLVICFVSQIASSGKLGYDTGKEAGNETWLVTLEGGLTSRPTVHSKQEAEEAFGDSLSKVTT